MGIKVTRARAPAKAIISGEHSVVYGQPALAMALPIYAKVEICKGQTAGIDLQLADLGYHVFTTPDELRHNHLESQARYQQFVDGQLSITQVLLGEQSLLLFAIAEFFNEFKVEHSPSLIIRLHSDIPMGSGMGSSAATIAALLRGLAGHMSIDLSASQLFELTRKIEQLQHGKSSGLDPAICCFGGLIHFCQGKIHRLASTTLKDWFWLDSGRPESITGECTQQVRENFADSDIWSVFGSVTQALQASVQDQSAEQIRQQLHINHQLLCQIGVVPEQVATLISQLEQAGAAAKVSGAGAVSGTSAGLVLLYHPQESQEQQNAVARLVTELGYEIHTLFIDQHGARLDSHG